MPSCGLTISFLLSQTCEQYMFLTSYLYGSVRQKRCNGIISRGNSAFAMPSTRWNGMLEGLTRQYLAYRKSPLSKCWRNVLPNIKTDLEPTLQNMVVCTLERHTVLTLLQSYECLTNTPTANSRTTDHWSRKSVIPAYSQQMSIYTPLFSRLRNFGSNNTSRMGWPRGSGIQCNHTPTPRTSKLAKDGQTRAPQQRTSTRYDSFLMDGLILQMTQRSFPHSATQDAMLGYSLSIYICRYPHNTILQYIINQASALFGQTQYRGTCGVTSETKPV